MTALPIGPAEFAALMAPFAPFEREPRIAVAVSGGADSLALLFLAKDWATSRGGSVVGLTVDHRLRSESAAEAAQVQAWAETRGISHRTIAWTESKPRGNLQAAARAARYRLLERECAETGILHLLAAHHREDQAETFLLRLARGSGLDGLAGMAAVVERAQCRILRPLLGVSNARMRATLESARQPWIEDPGNANPAFARTRLRQSRDILAAEGLTSERLAATATRLARTRRVLENAVADLLARCAVPHPAGYITLDRDILCTAPGELGLRALAAILAAVAGAAYPPRAERLERLLLALQHGLIAGRTLSGCRVLPRREGILICREAAAVAPPIPALPGENVHWDGRFRISVPATAPLGLTIGALGTAPLSLPPGQKTPAVIRETLPAVRDDRGVVAVPPLDYSRPGAPPLLFGAECVLLRASRPATRAGVKVA
jgi:tRNA(Ile)-lysidine synthase